MSTRYFTYLTPTPLGCRLYLYISFDYLHTTSLSAASRVSWFGSLSECFCQTRQNSNQCPAMHRLHGHIQSLVPALLRACCCLCDRYCTCGAEPRMSDLVETSGVLHHVQHLLILDVHHNHVVALWSFVKAQTGFPRCSSGSGLFTGISCFMNCLRSFPRILVWSMCGTSNTGF